MHQVGEGTEEAVAAMEHPEGPGGRSREVSVAPGEGAGAEGTSGPTPGGRGGGGGKASGASGLGLVSMDMDAVGPGTGTGGAAGKSLAERMLLSQGERGSGAVTASMVLRPPGEEVSEGGGEGWLQNDAKAMVSFSLCLRLILLIFASVLPVHMIALKEVGMGIRPSLGR